MKISHLHGGELSGVIFGVLIIFDLIAEYIIKTTIFKITPLINIGWLKNASIVIGIVLLIIGCMMGYISHEMFNKAVSPNGDVKHIMKEGVYSLSRHPFYLSLLLITLSFSLLLKSYILSLGFPIVVIILVNDAKQEEIILEKTFGEEYFNYRKTTGMFFPKLLKARK
jgi:protein-S-isoprenylcysteine O-methyltransferase Ste14